MKKLHLILIVLFFAACKKQDFNIENLNANRIDVLGHAGSGIASLYPINSMESFLNCFSDGADGTELDVQLTADNVLVAFHDEELDNSTNLSGRVRSKTWTEISEGHYDVVPLTQYNIIRVEDLMNATLTSDRIFTFDIKILPHNQENIQDYFNSYTEAIHNLYEKYDLYNQSFVESQNEDFITTLAGISTAIKQFIYPQVFEDGLEIAQTHSLQGITISHENITLEQVQLAHTQGFLITIWGVKSNNEHSDAIMKNPDMIQSDNISYLDQLLD